MTEGHEDSFKPPIGQELIGHNSAERAFLDAYNQEKLHHAWMITGAKGIGKSTFAWRIASFLAANIPTKNEGPGLFGDELPSEALSLSIEEDHPILERIASRAHDGIRFVRRTANPKTKKLRSDIVIDDIRSLIQFYNQTSSDGGWRIAIIDSVDDLNVSAANALLKILEEPPEKSILLLISHSPGKLLPTIKSRCRQLKMQPLKPDSVKAVLAARFPELSVSDMADLSMLSEGSPGRAVELMNVDGLSLYRQFLGLLMQMPQLSVPDLHKFTTDLAALKNDHKYRLFQILFARLVQIVIRHKAVPTVDHNLTEAEGKVARNLAAKATVEAWLDLSDRSAALFIKTDRVNLDKKQVLLTLFGDMSALMRR